MTGQPPYSRIYWKFRDEFPAVYADNDLFAWWTRLLMIAEGAHPTAGILPRGITDDVIERLQRHELLTIEPGDRFRIRGLTAERDRRQDAATKGGIHRSEGAERGPDGRFLPAGSPAGDQPDPPAGDQPVSQPSSYSKDETRRAEQSKDETRTTARAGLEPIGSIIGEIGIGEDAVPLDVRRLQRLAEELTGQAYVMNNVHSGYGKKAVAEQLPHGFDRVERAWRKIANQAKGEGTSLPTLRQLVLGADDLLNPIPQQDSAEQREEAARELFDRRVERTRRETEAMRKHIEKEPA